MIRSFALPVLLGACAPAIALAQNKAPQYRELALIDGRAITAEVLSTEATGLRLRTPQGVTLVSFELLVDMMPTAQASYAAQRPWSVHVAAPDELRDPLLAAFRSIPALEVHAVGEAAGGLSGAQAAAAERCALDLECIVEAVSDAPWRWVVVAMPQPGGQLKLVSAVSTGPTRHRAVAPSDGTEALWAGAHEALMLEVPASGPPSLAAGAGDRPNYVSVGEHNVVALSFAPIPGLPSLRQRDPGGFAAALGIVVPTTALWVGAVGQNAQSVPETAALGVVGFYAATVLANQVTGLASARKGRRSNARSSTTRPAGAHATP